MPLQINKVETLEKIVLGKCESFVNMAVWPAGEKLKPKKWLQNFSPGEKEHALYLLNNFCYFNPDICTALLKSVIVNLSLTLDRKERISEMQSDWQQMLMDTIFIPAIGENHNVTDSGYAISSYLRRELKIDQSQIFTVDDLYGSAHTGTFQKMKNIVFFDDFIGSGNQFMTMYGEEFEVDTDWEMPIQEKCNSLNLKPHFCTLLGSRFGVDRVLEKFPELSLNVAHILEPNSSPFHSDNLIWPEHLKSTSLDFMETTSKRAGIPDAEIKGYFDLGLSVAFEWTIPDATLPLFRWQSKTWSALMEKS